MIRNTVEPLLCLFVMCFAQAGFCQPVDSLPPISLPPVIANTNHAPAGNFRDNVLSLQLVIAKGEWHPEAEDGVALSVYAFGEAGHQLQNPGPLIRVPQGAEISAMLQNTLDVPITVHGLGGPSGSDAAVHVAPGATERVSFKCTNPGLYFYWGASEAGDLKLRYGIDSELTGAFVVDPIGSKANDEIFVIEMMSEVPGLAALRTLATINGKSWPFTQHLQYAVGQTVHWRWINATNEPHALHLHGFYYWVDAFNHAGRMESYSGDSRPRVVTQRIAQGETFDMSWSPDRAGQWLFHCHMFLHMNPPIIPRVPGLSMSEGSAKANGHGGMQEAAGMGQMVLGITVPGAMKSDADWHAGRKLRLEISERPGIPRYSVQVHDDKVADSALDMPALIGSPIVLTRGQPTEIEVVNKLHNPTAIHWHGIELESYYDGVAGWSGAGSQVMPSIAPGSSFVARMTPPRAGTFIYHTHWHDPLQLINGIYGPLIVLPPGEKYDPKSDLSFVISKGDLGTLEEMVLINGTPQSKTLQLSTGKRYRFRLINITTNNQGVVVSLRDPKGPVEWRVIAKDGADLPPDVIHMSKAQQIITVGETYDVEFLTPNPQDLVLEVLLPGQKIHISQTLAFTVPDKATE